MQIFHYGARLALSVTFAFTLNATCLSWTTAFAQDGGTKDASADQVEAGTEEKTVAAQIQELSDDLLTREEDLQDLRAKIQKEKGSAAGEILGTELIERRKKFRRGVAELVKLILQGQDGGADVAQARALAARLLQEDAMKIRTERSELGDKLLALADTIERGSPEEAAKARQNRDGALPVSDRLLRQFDENIRQRRELGLDVDSDVKRITKALESRSKMMAGSLQRTKDDIDRLAARPDVDADVEAQKQLADLKEQRDLLAESQRVNVSLMDEYGLETADLRQGIISSTGKISQDILDKDVAAALIEEWTADATDWFRSNGAALVFELVMFLLVLLAFWVLARIARGAVRRALNRSKVGISSLARDFFIKTTGRLIMFVGVIIAIAQLGIEVGPLLAGLGIAGFVVGFALQDTLSNFASGMMILIYRPFDVGDVIEAGGVMGKVHEMNLVATMVLTPDNQLLVVPNTQIWGGVIRNVTHQSTRRVDMTFGIGYSDDIPKAERVLHEIVEAHDKVLKDPEPVIRLHELGDSSVNFVVRPWSKTDDYWDVYWDITREVKRRFDEEEISIPFPQRDVHVYHEQAPAVAAPESNVQRSRTDHTAQEVAPGDDDIEA
jgi:small conductance mechanosensitive channel